MQRVATPSGRIGWTLTYGDGTPVEPVERFLRYRFYAEASPNTLRAYAHDLKLFFGFAAEQGLGWRTLTPADLGSFTAWLRRPAPNVLQTAGRGAGAFGSDGVARAERGVRVL